jgi:hypothetical protein
MPIGWFNVNEALYIYAQTVATLKVQNTIFPLSM